MTQVKKRYLPSWFKASAPGGKNYLDLKQRFRTFKLHTVCEEAACPNIGDCWERRTATFMILGDVCTRACAYCNVKTGLPGYTDPSEPIRLARTVKEMQLNYTVITSVDRDDLPDGGASIFAMSIRAIKEALPSCKVEVLIPDFSGSLKSLKRVINADPAVINHNIETVPRIFKKVRPKGNYWTSIELLERAKTLASHIPTKSGIMVGLGETKTELFQTMQDVQTAGCSLLTVGQYLRPTKRHYPIIRFYHPEEFEEIRQEGLSMGFSHVVAGPLVRSSYHADEQHRQASVNLVTSNTASSS